MTGQDLIDHIHNLQAEKAEVKIVVKLTLNVPPATTQLMGDVLEIEIDAVPSLRG